MITLLLCFLVGISLGLLGGGGTVLTVPIFVYISHVPAPTAIAMSLVIVGLVSLISSVSFSKKGFLNKRLVFLFTVSGIPMALLGAQWTSRVNPTNLLLMFSALMCLVAIILLIKSTKEKVSDQPLVCRPGVMISLLVGASIGFLTGFLGVGGGFLIVPAIAILMSCSLHTAIGTSLAIIAINSLTGFVGHLGSVDLNMGLLLSSFVVMLPGAMIGTKLASHLNGQALQRAFAILILVTGVFVAFQNLPV